MFRSTLSVLLAVAALAGLASAPQAASAATTITGVARTDSGRVAGATITLHRNVGGSWYRTNRVVRANSQGRYTLTGLPNGTYSVHGYRVFGQCGISITPIYEGFSRVVYARGGTQGADIRMRHTGYFPC